MGIMKATLALLVIWIGTLYLLQETKLLTDLVLDPNELCSISPVKERTGYRGPESIVVVTEDGTLLPYPQPYEPLDRHPYYVVHYQSFYNPPPLRGHMIVESRKVISNNSYYPLLPYYAVVGPLWVGVVMWPGLFLSTRIFMVACNRYQTTEFFERFLCVVFCWAWMAAAILLVATKQELQPVTEGLRIGALAAVVPVVLFLSTPERTNFVSLASVLLYSWHFSAPARPRHFLEFGDGGVVLMQLLIVILFPAALIVGRLTDTHIIEYAFRNARDAE